MQEKIEEVEKPKPTQTLIEELDWDYNFLFYYLLNKLFNIFFKKFLNLMSWVVNVLIGFFITLYLILLLSFIFYFDEG